MNLSTCCYRHKDIPQAIIIIIEILLRNVVVTPISNIYTVLKYKDHTKPLLL